MWVAGIGTIRHRSIIIVSGGGVLQLTQAEVSYFDLFET